MKMKALLLCGALALCLPATAQVKIGNNPQAIDAASLLELESTDRVLVITRVNTAQMEAITPSVGALVFNTDAGCLYYYDGAFWVNICESLPITFDNRPIVNPARSIEITQLGDTLNFEVALNAIRSENIVDFSIGSQDIQNNAINDQKLAPNSVGTEELQDNAVTDNELDYGAVTLADFTNDAGYITAANIVSGDAGNSITPGSDNGAYFNAESLETMIFDNADAITALQNDKEDVANKSDDTALGNSVALYPTQNAVKTYVDATVAGAAQSLTFTSPALGITSGNTVDLTPLLDNTDDQQLTDFSLNGANVLSLTLEDGGTQTVDLNGLNNAGTDDQQITDLSLNGANVLSLSLEDGGTQTVDLNVLNNPGTDDQTAAEVDFAPYLSINGANVQAAMQQMKDELDAVSAGSGTTELADQATITGDGTPGNEFQVADGGIAALQLADNAVTTPKILDANITPAKIEPSGTAGQVLTTVGGVAVWQDPAAGGTTELADQVTIDGDGALGNEFGVANLGIGTAQLADGAVTTTKVAIEGAEGQVLTTTGGNVVWADPAGGAGTAADISFATYTSLTALNVQGAIEQFKDEFDAALLAGGSDGVVSNVALNGTGLDFTGTISAFNGSIDLDPTFVTEAELAASEAADGDTDANNEIELPVGGNNGDVLSTDGLGNYSWITAVDSDNQNIQGSALTAEILTIGIENGTSQDVDLSSFALDADVTAAIAASDAADGDTDPNNEIELPAGGNNGDFLSTDGAGTYAWAATVDTDAQNIQGSGLVGETLTIGIQNGTSQDVDLSSFALDTDVTAAIAASDAADGDTDPNNEIEIPAGGNNGDFLSTDGAGNYAWTATIDTDAQNIQGSGLVGETLTIGIQNGTSQNVDLSVFALDTDVSAAIAASDAADGDTDSNNEIELPAGGNNGDVLATDGAGNYSWAASTNTDNQNIQGSGLAGQVLTIGIQNGTSQNVNLGAFALETEMTAAIAASDAADGDTDSNNEIELPTGGNNGDFLSTDGAGNYTWAASANTDNQNIQGSGLAGQVLTIGIQNGTSQNVNLGAFALETEMTAAIAASDAADGDTDPINEIELPAGGNNGDVLATDGIGNYSWIASTGTDNQNIQGSGLLGQILTIGIQNGTSESVDLSPFALDAEVTAAIAASDAADGDTDSNNEIELPAGGNNGDVLSTNGAGTYNWIASTSTDNQNIQGSGLAVETLTIGIENGASQDVNLSSFALETEVAAAIAFSDAADGDTDPNNEIELPAGGNNGDVLVTDGASNYSWNTPTAGVVNVDGTTITGDGNGTPLAVALISGGPTGQIAANSITQGDIDTDAIGPGEIQANAVGTSELDTDAVTTSEILNGTILNEDISATAGIDGTKIIADFGTQDVITAGDFIAVGGLSVGGDILLNGNNVVPDYVFQSYFTGASSLKPNYQMPSLNEVREFVAKYHHLPGVTSAEEVKAQGGIILNEATTQNLEKIEELFLHTLEQEAKIEDLQEQNAGLSKELEAMKERMARIEAAMNPNNGK